MFGLNSEIEFESTGHEGLWDEEASCRVLVFVSDGVSAFYRFSVAFDATAADGLAEAMVRARLRRELVADLERRLPDALGMLVTELETGGIYWERRVASGLTQRRDALRRLGYQSLAPHGMCRLGGDPVPDGEESWRRTLR